MKKEDAIKSIKKSMKPLHEVISDDKLIYMIDKLIKKGIKEHKKFGCVQPETLLVSDDGKIYFMHQNGEDKYEYFHLVYCAEQAIKPKYVIAIHEGYCVSGEDLEKVYEQYGAIRNHPDAYDVFNVNVKTETEVFSGMAIVEGKKVGEFYWMKHDQPGKCNFTTFSG
ncbi:hypothetical protein [Cupriavidus sp. H19C3]|uniref:hypothetical protein n=1 Tax=Cupriavidus sp. H19C3 TaxID=3241603 RepID=UPI003BF774C0